MQDETHIWTYIPVADFDVPSPPASDAARGGMRRLWKSLQSVIHRGKKEAPTKDSQWHRPSVDMLRTVTPDANWKPAATAFATDLSDDWFERRQPDRPLRALVGPPGCDIAEVLHVLAQQRQLNVLAAPSPEALLGASKSDMSALRAVDELDNEILVIPHLERWYLRHEEGLTLVRNLIERLIISRRRVLIGCDSWAWAFLQHAIGIEDLLGEPQTFAPFDAQRLDAWFRSTLDLQGHEFRQTSDDQPVFPEIPNLGKTNTKQLQRESSKWVTSLAARARGNPGVALALWRASLRTQDAESDESAPPAASTRSVLWAAPDTELVLSQLPVDIGREDHFVLHAVLLHGGLALSPLVTILPFSHEQIRRRVSLLIRAGMLEEQQGRLRVTLTSYPFLRQDLLSEGFLTDAF